MAKGRNNRRAGCNWELDIIKLLKEKNLYPHAVSTRSESRSLDGAGIDIMNHDEHAHGLMNDSIQAKSTTISLSYPGLLSRIRETGRPHPVVFHKQTGRGEGIKSTGKLFITRDIFAISYLDSYLEGMAARQVISKLAALNDPRIQEILNEFGL